MGPGTLAALQPDSLPAPVHEVAVSNSRGPETLNELGAEIGDNARALTVEEAARFGDVVLVAIPFGKFMDLPPKAFYGKVVIDAGNYYPERDGAFPTLDSGELTSSELTAAHLRGARTVKGFNTIYFEHLARQGDTGLPLDERRAIFIAGDDTGAKEIVAKLIEEIGFAAVDTGFLHEGGALQQPGTAVHNRELTAKQAADVLGSV